MNTEYKIPTPKITFPNKAALKRKPLVQTWTKVAAAAAVVVALGLGYFFSQWSAPPVVVVAQEAPAKAPIVVAPEVKPEESIIVEKPEPVVTITKHTPQVVEHTIIKIDTTVSKKIIEPISTHIETIAIELAINTMSQIKTQVQEVLIAEPKSREYMLDIAFMSEYGSDVVEQVKQIPRGIVQLAQSYARPFNKNNKKQE